MSLINSVIANRLASASWKQRVLPPEIANTDSIRRALQVIRGRWPQTSNHADNVAPVFLLSAGWGSGSTLVQRLIMSDKNTMLWGEPFDHAVPVCRMAQMIAPVDDKWPRDHYFAPPNDDTPLEMQWIANLTPPFEAMVDAHRAYFKAWLGEPALAQGRERWGFKEVRLTADHARYLKWLFPGARIVFVFRDVLDSWRSCQNVNWLSVWPNHKVARASAFAHHWCQLLEGFLEAEKQLDAFMIRYEDLIAGDVDLDALADHVGTGSLDSGVMDVRLGQRGTKSARVKPLHEAIIRKIAGPLRSRVRYET